MIALVESGDAALAWSNRALDLARGSSQPEAHRWVASLLNNIGWAHHEAGRYGEALGAFRSAQDERERRGDAREVRIARWCVARALRSLGKLEDALREQMALAVDHAEAGTRDGYVHEELAECLQALGRPEEARAHFAAAFELLGSDAGLCASDPVRVHRLGVLAGLSSDRPSGAAAPGQPI